MAHLSLENIVCT